MWMIMKILKLCADYPNNLGIIYRREFTDLRDSTMKDFKEYTNLKINMQRNEVEIPGTGSTIMFRHAKDLDMAIKQNVNLGFFGLEQADELESNDTFYTLFGRLRRGTFQQGIVIANATDENHWLYPIWKKPHVEKKPKADFPLWEATTFDNADNLPEGFLKSLEITRVDKPAIYERYVENSWNVGADRFILISSELLLKLQTGFLSWQDDKKIISCDPALDGDECVLYYIKNGEKLDEKIIQERDTMKTVAELMIMGGKYKCDDYIIDIIGIGKGIGDRLREMKRRDMKNRVQFFNSAEKENIPKNVLNRRAQAWWYVEKEIRERRVPYPDDPILRKQLTSVHYVPIDSSGKTKIESKKDLRKRLGCSPDRADTYIMGIFGLQNVKVQKPRDAWTRKRRSGGPGDWLTA